ncbi:MAG: spore coat protein [Clostridiales bacterium]|nr:spore coat protein [Clostridiales bacterium]
MACKLTGKEVTIISDLLTMEESAIKKAKVYSKTLTNKELAGVFKTLEENHQKRFNDLLNLL